MITSRRVHFVALVVSFSVALAGTAQSAAAAGWPWPVEGAVITTYMNGSDPYAAGQHRGIDIASPVGSTVHSAVEGEVTYAGRLPDGGITATVRSDDGRYLVSFLHLAELRVSRNQSIAAGAAVGSVGLTGKRSAEQPHLHLSVRAAASGAYVDPLPLLGPLAIKEPPVADAPAVAKPMKNAAPQAQARTQARTQARAQSRTRRNARGRQHAAVRERSHRSQPQNVHAPTAGDSVSAQPHRAAADSARESHASAGKGRVAPPPLTSERPADLPKTVTLATPGRASDVASNRPAPKSTRSTFKTGLLALAVLSVVALLIRRRRAVRDRFEPPPTSSADGSNSQAAPQPDSLVELRARRRRA